VAWSVRPDAGMPVITKSARAVELRVIVVSAVKIIGTRIGRISSVRLTIF
jgi:hypothetical protein